MRGRWKRFWSAFLCFRVRTPLSFGKGWDNKKARKINVLRAFCGWLPRRDSNPNKQNQNLLCYHYTTRQWRKRRVL